MELREYYALSHEHVVARDWVIPRREYELLEFYKKVKKKAKIIGIEMDEEGHMIVFHIKDKPSLNKVRSLWRNRMGISVEKLLEEIRNRKKTIARERIYFTLKKMGIKRFRQESIETIATFLAAHAAGFRYLTVKLLLAIEKKDFSPTRLAGKLKLCHTLGDKLVLELYTTLGQPVPVTEAQKVSETYAWKISKIFMDQFKRSPRKSENNPGRESPIDLSRCRRCGHKLPSQYLTNGLCRACRKLLKLPTL